MSGTFGIYARHFNGNNTSFDGSLYLNYGNNAPVYLGNTGRYTISADGSYYSGKCNYANSAGSIAWGNVTGKPSYRAYFCNIDNNNNFYLGTLSAYPSYPGVYRVGAPIKGLPSGISGYGTLVIFNGGSYVLHLYMDSSGRIYWGRGGGSDYAIGDPPGLWGLGSYSSSVSSIT